MHPKPTISIFTFLESNMLDLFRNVLYYSSNSRFILQKCTPVSGSVSIDSQLT